MPAHTELRAPVEAERLLASARLLLGGADLDTVLVRFLHGIQTLTGERRVALGLVGRAAAEQRRYLVATDTRAGGRWLAAAPRWLTQPGSLRLPLTVAGRLYGTLYVAGAGLTEPDRDALATLTGFAGDAIDHALERRRAAAERTQLRERVEALNTTREMAHAIAGETDLIPVLGEVAEYARSLVTARAVVIEYLVDGSLVVAASAGEAPADLAGRKLDVDNSLSGAALRRPATLRIETEGNRQLFEEHGLGALGVTATAGLVVPLTFMGQAHGALIAIDRLEHGPSFSEHDRQLLEACAESAAAGIATAEAAEAERLRERLDAVSEERIRWGRELHDDTLQSLASVRLRLSSELQRGRHSSADAAITEAIAGLDEQITHLRALILSLRSGPPTINLAVALQSLAARLATNGPRVVVEIEEQPGDEQALDPVHLAVESATVIYRICHEALTNSIRHAGATAVKVRIGVEDGWITTTVSDDGSGFDPDAEHSGFGLTGIRERARLAGGTAQIESSPDRGTTVTAVIPRVPPPQAPETEYHFFDRRGAAPKPAAAGERRRS